MKSGEIIAQYLCQLPDEFKSLLKRKDAGKITQQQLQDQCDTFTLSKLYLLTPRPFPTQPQRLTEFELLPKREQKERKEEIGSVRSEWQSSRLQIAVENEMNLRELRRLLEKYKNTTETEKILRVISKHQEYYPPFKGNT